MRTSPKIPELAADLKAIAAKQWERERLVTMEDRHLFREPHIQREVKIIGSDAAYIGGAAAMGEVMTAAFCEFDEGFNDFRARDQMSMWAMSELNYLWDGIDHWKA